MKFLALSALLAVVLSIQFSVSVPQHKVRCFYEHLAYQAKYSVEVTPMDISDFEFFIQMVESDGYLFTKTLSHSVESVTLYSSRSQ